VDLPDDEVEITHGLGPIVLGKEDALVHPWQRLEQSVVLVQIQV
jgi:hypothetical protein